MKPILTDLYQKWMSDGELFTMMGVRHVTPWAEETDGKALDLEYFGNRSGSKIVAPLLEKMVTETGLSDASKQNIVDLIWIRFGRNWGKLWYTLTVDYNPIENYRMTETGKIDHDGAQNNDVFGFNSTAAVPSGTGHDEYIDNTQLTRSGNIGVTTSQQMIQSERDLWVWKFFEQVFQDVDTVLSIDVYGQSCLGDFSEYHGGGSEYVLPPATATTLGGIKVGENLSITPDGILSAQGGELPPATDTTLGGIKVGDNLSITPDGTLSAQGGSTSWTFLDSKTGGNQNIELTSVWDSAAEFLAVVTKTKGTIVKIPIVIPKQIFTNNNIIAGGYFNKDYYRANVGILCQIIESRHVVSLSNDWSLWYESGNNTISSCITDVYYR